MSSLAPSTPQQLPSEQSEQQHTVTAQSPNSNTDCTNSDATDAAVTTSGAEHPTTDETTEEHLLRHNDDYQHVLAACRVLQNQLKQCKKDIERLRAMKENSLADPIRFVEQLRAGTKEKAPSAQRVVAVPRIDISKYRSQASMNTRTTRQTAGHHNYSNSPTSYSPKFPTSMYKNNVLLPFENDPYPKSQSEAGSNVSRLSACVAEVVAGLDKPTKKSNAGESGEKEKKLRAANFNLPWTDQEQRKLEILLQEYPDEPVLAKRCEKIANALGSRTSLQVASRIQKYFAKLAQYGLPVPGRTPTSFAPLHQISDERPSVSSASLRTSGLRYLQRSAPTVYMSDDDESTPMELDETDGYGGSAGDVVHHGYRCDGCSAEPIIGPRWNCKDCVQDEVDLCEDCYRRGDFERGAHRLDHKCEKITSCEVYQQDEDYGETYAGEYSYLEG